MVEYIIVLGIIAVIMSLVFPSLRENLSEWASGITNEGAVQTTTEVAEKGMDLGNVLPVVAGIMGGIMGVAAIIFFIVNSMEKETSAEKKKEPKKIPVKEERPEKTWSELWKEVQEERLLSKSYVKKINEILEKTHVLLPQVQEYHWTEETHTLVRIKEIEIHQLVKRYVDMNEKLKTKQEKKFEKALLHIEKELLEIEVTIDKHEENQFNQTVRVIETRYED